MSIERLQSLGSQTIGRRRVDDEAYPSSFLLYCLPCLPAPAECECCVNFIYAPQKNANVSEVVVEVFKFYLACACRDACARLRHARAFVRHARACLAPAFACLRLRVPSPVHVSVRPEVL